MSGVTGYVVRHNKGVKFGMMVGENQEFNECDIYEGSIIIKTYNSVHDCDKWVKKELEELEISYDDCDIEEIGNGLRGKFAW